MFAYVFDFVFFRITSTCCIYTLFYMATLTFGGIVKLTPANVAESVVVILTGTLVSSLPSLFKITTVVDVMFDKTLFSVTKSK